MVFVFGNATLAAVLATVPAAAHVDGTPPGPHDFWTMWSLDPLVVLPLIVAAALYSLGLVRRWSGSGLGRGVPKRRAAAFAGGVLALVAALVWPLDAMGESLLAAHMAQHVVLMNLAAPLLAVSNPGPTIVYALPRSWRRRLAMAVAWRPVRTTWRFLAGVFIATMLQQVALWIWHTPGAIAAALHDDFVHVLMHGSLLAVAFLFWIAVSYPRDLGYGWSILALLVTAKLCGFLGVLMIFAPQPLYPAYADRSEPWGISAVEDQQLAGLVMMPSAGAVYLIAATVLAIAWLGRIAQQASNRPAFESRPAEFR
ncbi:cytochrome c oxidase assembly protein [Chelativorans intermedius]|uniref:Cytochrome c oxidase assembly protein n=1 Tax=Chelativorans intermedius TaxID=515947 RepID=A0ABV6D848_9HYPH|nr:cytochrome c oxidase assembly protein [Chelativorans intermedius]MCT8999861.1 cytochrome c oxidase assembly protein [Chelativorans intermedius]